MELNWIYEILDNGITLEDYDTTAKECAVVDGNDHEGEIKLLGKYLYGGIREFEKSEIGKGLIQAKIKIKIERYD